MISIKNSLITICLILCVSFFLSCTKSTDIPVIPKTQNIPSVIICAKTWMAKNLDVVTFRNGDTIQQVSGDKWGDMTILETPVPAWCYFGDDPSNDSTYGKLYNWAAINDPRGLAPEGWHVATYNEWRTLVDSCLGGPEIAGQAMKEAGFSHWDDPGMPKYYGTNSSGLNCLPGGYRDDLYFLNPLGFSGNWWCANGDENGKPYMIWLYHLDNGVHFARTGNDAVSVRCVKD